MVKIAVVCPIGHLTHHGYQYVYQTCIESLAAFSDTVYLLQSTRDRAGVDELIEAHDNIVYVGSDKTWFDADPGGMERFDLNQVGENINLGLAMARADGHDAAIAAENNQYIPEAACGPLRDACEMTCALDQPYEWLYRRDQLADVTFHASLRRPWIFNLTHEATVQEPDGSNYLGRFIRHERGNFPRHDAAALVDCPLEMSLEDLNAKMTYFRSLIEFAPKRPRIFSWDYWRDYSLSKFRQKVLDDRPLDQYGKAIAEIGAAHPEFLSHEILELLWQK